MDLQYVNPSNGDAFIDFRRFVLLFAHRFSDRIRFVSELEVEHALVEGGEEKGELELEQAYLDFLIDRRFNIRAGQLLVPVGIINERHEPPVLLRRPAPVRRHLHHPDDLVRRGRGRVRRIRPRVALSRLRDGAARCHAVQRRRRSGRVGPEGFAVDRAPLGRHRPGRVPGHPASRARRELLERTHAPRDRPTVRSPSHARRSRRTRTRRPTRSPRRVRAGLHRRRRRAESPAGAARGHRSQRRQPDAGRYLEAAHPLLPFPVAARGGGLRALRDGSTRSTGCRPVISRSRRSTARPGSSASRTFPIPTSS